MMRRTLIIVVTAAAAALGGVWAASAVAPCAMPRALSDKIAPGKAAACPAPAQSAADHPRGPQGEFISPQTPAPPPADA